jgi:diguanylate cyclase (GGDEF)-like protein/PAS domain S-box-containing protein
MSRPGGRGEGEEAGAPERLELTWAQLDRMLTYIDEAIVCVDAVGMITFAGAAISRLTGHDPATLIGSSIADFVHPDDLVELLRLLDRWHDRPGSGWLEAQRIRGANGDWLRMTIDAVSDSGLGPLGAVVATLRLADHSSDAEEELRQRLVEQGRLVRVASTFVHLRGDQVDDGVQAALAELGSMGAVDRVEVILFDTNGDTMTNSHEWVAPGVDPMRYEGRTVPVGDFALLREIRANREVNIPSVADLGPGWEAEQMWFTARRARAVLAVPLADRGQVIGFMGFEAVLGEWAFTVNHVVTLRSAAGILGQAFAKRSAEERLEYQAGHDPLTGLPNRWAFVDALRHAVFQLGPRTRSATGHGGGVAVILFDIDRFKVVNDSLGHQLGDQLLVIISHRVEVNRPDRTLLARMGGDELAVLVEGVDSADDAVVLARELRSAIHRPVMVDGHEMTTTASAGIAFTLDPEETADDLLRHADAALYAAKEFGRDRIEVFDDALRTKVRRRLQNEIELRHALDHQELVVHYQPEVEVPSGQVVAVEALVRWNHPERGLLTAAEFIDVAEETGIIAELGLWVLREACAQQVSWQHQFPDHELQMRVNLSAVQLGQPDLLSDVVEILTDTGVAPGQLCLEITETVVMADAQASLARLEKLRGLGLELAIDDFGTGYSSLSYLKRLPVNVLKIDRSFVDGLGTDPDDAAIVDAILVLAAALGLRVTAEGVENKVQLDELVRLGCRRVQGFYFAEPQPPDQIAERLAGESAP